MKELLIANGWVHFRTGCSCNGAPRFYKNDGFFDYTIIVRNNKFSIKKGNSILTTGKPEQFKETLIKYGFISENQNVESQSERT